MMKKLYQFSMDIIDILSLLMLATSFTFLIYTYNDEPFPYIQIVSFGTYIICSYLINCFCNHLILFIGSQVLLAASLFLWQLPITGMIFTVILCFFLICSNICFWAYNNEIKTPHPAQGFLVVFFISCIITSVNDYKELSNLNYIFGIFFTIGFILRSYFKNLLILHSTSHGHGYAPFSSIIRRNNRFVFSIIGAFLIFSLLVELPDIEGIFVMILSCIGGFFKWLLRLLFAGNESGPLPTPSPLPSPKPEIAPFMDIPAEPNKILVIIERIFFTAFTIFLIFTIIFLLVRLIRYIWKNYRLKSRKILESYDEFSTIETKEKLIRQRSHRFTRFRSGNINTQIRNLYRNKVIFFVKHGYSLRLEDTPNERASDIQSSTSQSIEQLTNLYNQARYSNHEISKDQLKDIKKED